MRIKIIIECSKLPLIYRNRVQSFLKTALSKSSEHFLNSFYENQVSRGFTFNVHFGKKEDYYLSENWLLLNNDNMMKVKCFNFKRKQFTIFVSSNDDNFMINLISGLRNMDIFYFSNQESKVFTIDHEIIKFKVKNILPVEEKAILTEEITCKTQSPFIFENKFDKPVLFYDDGFQEQINRTMSKILEKPCNIEFTPIDLRKTVIKHTISKFLDSEKPLMFLTGNEGTFKLKSDIETLKYIYNCGFGVRSSQGFGMLDIIS